CYPPHWWTSMKSKNLQIMVYSEIADSTATYAIQYPGVILKKVVRPENKRYVFLDLQINPKTKPGFFRIEKRHATTVTYIPYELKKRRSEKGKSYAQGVDAGDFMYLIMPDRFANGDTSNDRMAGMRDQSLRRDTVFNRHGGDLKGIENKLDYLQDLGVTAIWLNPIWENDMPNRTEHGYAFTNHYRVDPRLGGNDAYLSLIDAAHRKGLKIIQDAVYNHVGLYHFTVQDSPMKDWLNQWDQYTNTTYKDQTLFDPYASTIDRKKMSDGWFTPQMPDLNQRNPFVARFLIQHALWSVEEFGIDGWRIDTYAYNDLDFMNACNQAILDEYPNMTLFGETWVHGVPNQSFFCENNFTIPYKSNLPAVTDFQTLWGITAAMNEDFGWTNGVNKLYTTLAQDFVYKNPMRNVIFLDNHDIARFYSIINENMDKYLSSICWLMTCRGIPQFYYTSEFATTGTTYPNDGYVRLDFPGGWKYDSINKFSAAGRSEKDVRIFNTVRTLAQFRKNAPAITRGRFMQYLPEDGLYVYFRYTNEQTVMVIMNTSKTDKKIDFKQYTERTNGFNTYTNVLTGEKKPLSEMTLGSYQSLVLELAK
ncbi:MAG: alpha-amylase family glycosyl hydrolase, partial [Ferruginibacter sp.]